MRLKGKHRSTDKVSQSVGENLFLIVYFPGRSNSNARMQAGLTALFLSSGAGINQRVNIYAAAL